MASDVSVNNTLPHLNKILGPFNNCTVTFSQLDNLEEKKKLKKQIKRLGGIYKRGWSPSVTHVIALDWNTRKALYARAHKKHVLMTPKWVEAVAKQSGKEILPANHPAFLIHRLPIFHGFTLCFSQVSLEKRAMLKQKVERNGGKYSGDFNPSVVTHLILCAPEGKKYDIALKFASVKKVNALWFTDSLKSGIPLPEEDYPPKELATTNNTLNTSKRKSGDSFPNMSDFLSCKKNKSNLFNNIFNTSTTQRIKQEMDSTTITPEKRLRDMSLEKADGFDNILKDLGNLGEQNDRYNTASPKPRSNSGQQEKRPQKLTLKTQLKSTQLSDKITNSLPVLWEASA